MENKLSNEEFLQLNITDSREEFQHQFNTFKTILEKSKSEEKLKVVNELVNKYLMFCPPSERTAPSRDYYTGEEDGDTCTYTIPGKYYFNFEMNKFTPYLEKLAHRYEVQSYEKADREKIDVLERED